jgi:hypothetical protein
MLCFSADFKPISRITVVGVCRLVDRKEGSLPAENKGLAHEAEVVLGGTTRRFIEN